jgi:CyaY protein
MPEPALTASTWPESDFLAAATAILDQLEEAIDRAADSAQADLDVARKANGILEVSIEADAGDSKVIINLQTPMREIWVAAKSGGYHFRKVGEQWHDTRSQEELMSALSRMMAEQAGETIAL